MHHLPNQMTRVASVVAIAGGLTLGATGIALAASGGGSTLPHQSAAPSPTPVTPVPGQAAAAPDQGTGDFTPAGETVEKPDPGEAQHAETEPANDPEPNHKDPNGSNVDHTPAGESATSEPAQG